MTQQNDPPPQRSSLNQFFHDYDWLVKIIVLLALGALGYKAHDNGTSIEFTKDIAAKAADAQQKQIAVQVRGTEDDVRALEKAATQPVLQSK